MWPGWHVRVDRPSLRDITTPVPVDGARFGLLPGFGWISRLWKGNMPGHQACGKGVIRAPES
jgi:hypothetical protein